MVPFVRVITTAVEQAACTRMTGGQIREAACMALARRRLHDPHAVRPSSITSEALERIGALYRIEEHIRGRPPEERKRARRERAMPLLEDMKLWFEATLLTC